MPPCLRPSSDLVPGIQTVLSAPFSMAEWHSSTNEDLRASFPDPSVMPTPSTPQSDSWVNLPHRDEQRELFDQALVACWKELPQAQGRPKVPIISDGKTVDLYKLSNNVKKKETKQFNIQWSKFKSPTREEERPSLFVGTYNGKRKYDSFLGLLKWIKRVARNPCGSIIRQGVDFSSHSEEWVQECWIQAIRARAVLCLQNEDRLSGEVLYGQKKQKVHPSLYEESHTANHQPLDRLRATDRRLALYVSSASTSMDSQSIQYFPRSSNVGNSTSVSSLLYLERISRRRIPISPNNQAIVPSWNGPKKCAGSGDSISVEVDLNLDAFKWLGTKVWPPEGGQMMVNKDRIGKGRPGRCLCFFPGSIECVRLHIREERDKLKSELGSAFFSWRFDDMGEDASMLWTPEEERKFRALVRLNPVSLKRNFWHHLSACFPSKSMELLVCYYFNVFVLRRRTLQNRVKPEKIDSDDDESEFGSVENLNMDGLVLSGMRTGHLLPRGNYSGETSGTLICQQNMQYNDFDVFGGPFEGGRNGKDIQNEHGVQHLRYNVAERGLNQGGT
ncbi:hypothetical protein SUGI_0861700 [Cryptomeria japonica]|nr:hypothetical protein SUGI_0861700 [Cryptomeria japonica]